MMMKTKSIIYIFCLITAINIHSVHLKFLNPKTKYHSLSAQFVAELKREIDLPLFIETGTYNGSTTQQVLHQFPTIHSIELFQQLYENAKRKFAPYPHVHIHQGDSGKVLNDILPQLEQKSLFWLDAHYSGVGTALIGCGTPIIEELEAIRKHGQKQSIIMIDDIRLFDLVPRGTSMADGSDFPNLAEIHEKLMQINPRFSFALIGDTLLAYDSHEPISVSSVVNACTTSRMARCLEVDDQEIFNLEKSIYLSQGAEKQTLKNLYDTYCIPGSSTPSPYYHIWYGLSLLADKHFAQAENQFKKAFTLNYNEPRIHAYIEAAKQKKNPYETN